MTFTKGHPRYGGMQRGQVVSIKREAFERLTYINDVPRAGGFSLILANQHYPLLSEPLAKRVRDVLGLPVLSIRELPETTLRRFEDWHVRQVPKRRR
jgi:hypothetical protein